MAAQFILPCLLTNMLYIRLLVLDNLVGSVIAGKNPELSIPSK